MTRTNGDPGRRPAVVDAYRGEVRFGFLLRPGWLALTMVVLVFAAVCFTLLAPWQFRRHAEREAQNVAVAASVRISPVPLDQADQREWRLVTATGHYQPEGEALARLRTVQGEAAFEVLTPFQLATGQSVLVDRGYVRPVNGNRVPDFQPAPTGQVMLVGRIRRDEDDPKNRPAFEEAGRRQVYTISSQTVARAAESRIRPGYLQLNADQPGVLGALPLPQLDAGPFLSYALQWIAFGTMSVMAWLYFTWRELKPGGALAGKRPRRMSVADAVAADDAREAVARGAAEALRSASAHTLATASAEGHRDSR